MLSPVLTSPPMGVSTINWREAELQAGSTTVLSRQSQDLLLWQYNPLLYAKFSPKFIESTAFQKTFSLYVL